MEYKRITISGYKIPENKEEVHPNFRLLYNRLAQLENDIESKKLQRLNCNVGDTIYYVAYYKVETDNREIEILEPWLVDSIVIGKNYQIYRLTHEGTDDYNSAHNVDFGEKWFTDKEKALAKLQELKEQNNG